MVSNITSYDFYSLLRVTCATCHHYQVYGTLILLICMSFTQQPVSTQY